MHRDRLRSAQHVTDSPNGIPSMSGSHASNNICLSDTAVNDFLVTVTAGRDEGGSFDGDVGFPRD